LPAGNGERGQAGLIRRISGIGALGQQAVKKCITLSERSGVSAEMALRLGTLLGNGAQLWLDMQSKYDLWQAEAKLHNELIQIQPLDQLALA
jgi:plasmid maintenance system antidote protein VapI